MVVPELSRKMRCKKSIDTNFSKFRNVQKLGSITDFFDPIVSCVVGAHMCQRFLPLTSLAL